MPPSKLPVNLYGEYHAHVYFGESTLELALELTGNAGEQFGVGLGQVHKKPVGPHPAWSRQIAFGADKFDQLIPWLDRHRQGLTVLVHGLTGDDLKDHTDHAYWLGQELVLDLSRLS